VVCDDEGYSLRWLEDQLRMRASRKCVDGYAEFDAKLDNAAAETIAMSDHERRLADIEKRLARVERAIEPRNAAFSTYKKYNGGTEFIPGEQWCECGRDVCRAPDCPSHKPDPLGR
jgi:hypothetical protein